ncbi:hypothetical protein MR829_11340 [Paracoccus versutus]|uniref:hypothetical protein n=1 Tax=Paracoccus versutus TaxID=34007 RepID=UPI001FB67585|nr:hypothetical protein [Paracoccus versutus]MCJ1900967.1 hypothetical protein [Paracoccus versutus]
MTIEAREGGGWAVLIETFMLSGRTQRKARAMRILANLKRNGWACGWCSGPVPEFRRADARYCCEGCRKRAARSRRSWRQVGPG